VAIETAVILAAGRGIRLGPLGRMIPKGFLELDGYRQPIVVQSIERLRARGIRRIVVVTGHLRTFYDELSACTAGLVTTVHNPHFAESGSWSSLACARELLGGEDFLLLESDLVYEARALDAALASPHADVVVVSGPTGSGDEVYVAAAGERIVAISKDPALRGGSVGELVGISKLSGRLFGRLLEQSDGDPGAEYETGALARIAPHEPVSYTLLPDLVWAEIDTPADFERVRRLVYPRLRRLEAQAVRRPAGRRSG
jgi:choline kinase